MLAKMTGREEEQGQNVVDMLVVIDSGIGSVGRIESWRKRDEVLREGAANMPEALEVLVET